MKIHFCLIILLVFFSCQNSSEKIEQEKTMNLIAINKSKELVYSSFFDFDKNGITDTFQIKGELSDELNCFRIYFNKNEYQFKPKVLGFKIFDYKFKKINITKDSIFLIFKISPSKNVLLIQEKNDFAGEGVHLFTNKDDSFKEILFNSENLIEIKDLDKDNYPEIIFEEIQTEPGEVNGYYFTEFTLYKVYKFKDDIINYDLILSKQYNKLHKKDFDKYISMKKPVLAYKIDESYENSVLIDLEEIKNK